MPDRQDAPSNFPDDLATLLADGVRRLREENPVVEHLTDAETGLFNVHFTRMKLAEEFKRTRRFKEPLTLISVAPDRAGEESREVRDLAGVFLCESRDIDFMARIGRAELLMILPHTDAAGGLVMARRVLDALDTQAIGEDQGLDPLGASAGVVTFEGAGAESPEALLERATEALTAARAAGSGAIRLWTHRGLVPG